MPSWQPSMETLWEEMVKCSHAPTHAVAAAIVAAIDEKSCVELSDDDDRQPQRIPTPMITEEAIKNCENVTVCDAAALGTQLPHLQRSAAGSSCSHSGAAAKINSAGHAMAASPAIGGRKRKSDMDELHDVFEKTCKINMDGRRGTESGWIEYTPEEWAAWEAQGYRTRESWYAFYRQLR